MRAGKMKMQTGADPVLEIALQFTIICFILC